MWCIASIEKVLNPTNKALQQLHDWSFSSGNIRGVSHDNSNYLFVAVPNELEGCNVLEVDSDKGAMAIIGSALTNETHDLIIAKGELFTNLFYSPLHRLWCFKYESEGQLQSDLEVVFEDAILDRSKAGIRTAIKNLFYK